MIPLTFWQARWAYFLALAFAMSLPALLGIFSKRRIAVIVFVIALWPVGLNWKLQLGPSQLDSARKGEQITWRFTTSPSS